MGIVSFVAVFCLIIIWFLLKRTGFSTKKKAIFCIAVPFSFLLLLSIFITIMEAVIPFETGPDRTPWYLLKLFGFMAGSSFVYSIIIGTSLFILLFAINHIWHIIRRKLKKAILTNESKGL